MTAMCLDCGVLRNWKATRGARLSHARCSCGGKLEIATWRLVGSYPNQTYEYYGRKSGRIGHWPTKLL